MGTDITKEAPAGDVAQSQSGSSTGREKCFTFRRLVCRRDVYNTLMIPTPLRIDSLDKQDALVPDHWRQAGFRFGSKGTHTSRTIMLSELRSLLDCCPSDASRDDYLSAVLEGNCLGKRTAATRKLSGQRLSELYGLAPDVLLFRVMRRCWYVDREGQALLAVLLALARDPLLRASAPPVLRMRPGEELARQQLTDAVSRVVGSRLSESTLDKVVRNVASSWTQSGHLSGRGRKVRRCVRPTAITVAYALLVGYILGVRGVSMFETLWAKVLDRSGEELIRLAMDAKRLGFLDMNQSGGMVEISFSRILTDAERRLIHGTD